MAHAIPSGPRPGAPGRGRRRFPPRTLHLIDIENLAGSAQPTLHQVQRVRSIYRARLAPGAADQVVLACNPRAFKAAGFGWQDSRHMVRSGRDGADLELLDVICHENVAERFSRVAIGSGDGAFAEQTARLTELGCPVIVISRRDALSGRLALAAHKVVYLDDVSPRAGELARLPRPSAALRAASRARACRTAPARYAGLRRAEHRAGQGRWLVY